MPVQYFIDRKARLVTTVFSGIFTDSDIWHLIDLLRKDPEYDPDFDELIDCRAVVENRVSAATLSAVRSSPKPRRAVVASSDKNYGIGRMFQALQTNQQIEVFRTLEEARKWLGL
jgi:hypothetical protein